MNAFNNIQKTPIHVYKHIHIYSKKKHKYNCDGDDETYDKRKTGGKQQEEDDEQIIKNFPASPQTLTHKIYRNQN